MSDIRDEARQEAERRWPSPNSGLYEGLIIGFEKGAVWAHEQADRERPKVPASVAPAAEENALVEIVAEWLKDYMPTPYVPFSDRVGLARTILAAGFRRPAPSDRGAGAATRQAVIECQIAKYGTILHDVLAKSVDLLEDREVRRG